MGKRGKSASMTRGGTGHTRSITRRHDFDEVLVQLSWTDKGEIEGHRPVVAAVGPHMPQMFSVCPVEITAARPTLVSKNQANDGLESREGGSLVSRWRTTSSSNLQ